jgi:uncharacterized heparinase superfamily protein
MSRAGAMSVRLAYLVALAARQSGLARLYASPLYRWRFARGRPDRLVIAPQDLRAADPTRAQEITEGRYAFAGKTLDLPEESPFAAAPPSQAWLEALLGFTWLRHLKVADGTRGRAAARSLVGAFMRSPNRFSPEALEPVTTARRLLSLLSQAPLVLEGADRGFYKAFVRSLNWQANYLMQAGLVGRDGMPRLVCALAATQASLCLSESGRLRRRATHWLARELGRQVLADGGHVSRNPQAVLDLLLDLLPLRQSFAARNATPPEEVMNAIDRMMPMLRLFRHGDGALAAFNGMGYTQSHLVATVLSYDDTRGRAIQNAPYSGYQRIEAGGSVLIADMGKVPPVAVSQEAHAGALSFEFSADNARIIVNCGAPAQGREDWRQPARVTAAHSTAMIGARSSAQFAPASGLAASLGRPIVAGPRVTEAERREDRERVSLTLSHDGYRRSFSLIHRRSLSVATASGALEGRDEFAAPSGAPWRGREAVTLRFHLHPQITPRPGASPAEVLLAVPGGRRWRFHVRDREAAIEESVHFANPEGPRRTSQIVVVLPAGSDAPDGVAWSLAPLP